MEPSMRRKSRFTRIALVVLGLTLMGSGLGRTERKKAFVDPLLNRIMRASEKAARDTGRPEAIPRDEVRFYARQAAIDEKAAAPAVRVRLRLDAAARRSVERMGIRTYGRLDGFASALVPVQRLRAIAALPGVEAMQAVRIPEMELNVSRGEVLSTQVETNYGSRGKGVILGSVDSGIDWRHEDFRNPDGTTRIKYIWSQDDACVGTPPPFPFDFGCLYSEADINAALTGGPAITAPDGEGHGTHTTGVAAGNGRATGLGFPALRYAGMAPEADIIMVKTFPEPGDVDGCATCYDISAGMDFIDAKAAEMGEPYVINISLGSQYGGHDGGDIDEMTIDTLIGPGIPGRAIVKSAGNERGHAIHIGGTAAVGITNTHTFVIPAYTALPEAFNDAVAWSLWYSDGDNLTVTIADPTTAPCGASTLTLSATTGQGVVTSNSSSGFMLIDDAASPAPNGARFFDMEVDDQGSSLPCRGNWQLRVLGNTITAGGRYDAWIWFTSFGASGLEALWSAPDLSRLISVPGTAFNVTTVGAYMTKYEWVSMDGQPPYHFAGTVPTDVGKLANFSSPGPTRDGRVKPDLNAPGTAIVSSLSIDAAPTAQVPLIVEDTVHWALPGTSFSAPHVAGIYAQILALNPNLDAIDLRTLATSSARVDANVSMPLPNNDWGYGKVSALGIADRAVQNIPDIVASASGDFSWTALPTATTYNVYRGDLSLKGPGYYGSCLVSGLAAPPFSDATVPVEDAGFFYHVTGVWNGIEGALGFASDGTPRLNSSPCP
jgi:subtilisin family serine protease